MKTIREIRMAYLKRYPHLQFIRDKKTFARAAIMLAAPAGVSPMDVLRLAKLANS